MATRAEFRRTFLDLARRRVQPGSGSSLAFLRMRTWSDPAMALDLHALQTPYLIVGGVATALYMPRRLTLDLDLLVLPTDAPALAAELSATGCVQEGPLAFGGTTWRTAEGHRLDVLESSEPWAAAAVGAPNRSPTGLPVIALPYLTLMKLAASRAQDLADLSRMLGAAAPALRDQVRAAVRRYRPADGDDMESLIALGELEYRN